MAPRVFRLPMPEGGDERSVVWYRHHNCGPGKALRAELGEDIDLLQFTVGLQGQGMPSNVPFEVLAADDCRACGAAVRAWFEWAAPRIWVPCRRSA